MAGLHHGEKARQREVERFTRPNTGKPAVDRAPSGRSPPGREELHYAQRFSATCATFQAVLPVTSVLCALCVRVRVCACSLFNRCASEADT